MTAPDIAIDTTEDRALGGRLILRQPKRGHRFGHDAILLAAATDAKAGDVAVEFGAGVGAAGLALAYRVPDLAVMLAEIDPTLAMLAQQNAAGNAMDDRVRAIACDVEDWNALAAAGLGMGSVDRVLMNPPFHDAGRHNLSPDARRRLAHAGGIDLLERWIASAARLLRPDGVLTLIWRADQRDEVLAALAFEFGDVAVRAVAPRPGAAPIRVLVRAVSGDGSAPREVPVLALNDARGEPSEAAEAILRHGVALPFEP